MLLKDNCVLWKTDLNVVPSLTYSDIFNYLVFTENNTHTYTLEEFKVYKSLDSYNSFVSSRIFNVKWIVTDDNVLVVTEVS